MTSDPRGLPLHKAIVRFQRPAPHDDQNTTSATIVQRMCDRITIDAPFCFVAKVDDHDCIFDIVVKGDIGDEPDSYETRGEFGVGYDAPAMYDGKDDTPFTRHVSTYMRRLHEVLNGSCRQDQNLSCWSVSAGVGDDMLAGPTTIAPGAFKGFKVTDWLAGLMTDGRISLRDVHIRSDQPNAEHSLSASQVLGDVTSSATVAAPRTITTTKGIRDAIPVVTAELKTHGDSVPLAHYWKLIEGRFPVAKNAFDRNVWPVARENAGLARGASPGAKARL